METKTTKFNFPTKEEKEEIFKMNTCKRVDKCPKRLDFPCSKCKDYENKTNS